MPPPIEDSVGSKRLASLWRWFIFTLLGLLVACSCAFVYLSKEARAEEKPSGEPAPTSEPAKSEPAPTTSSPSTLTPSEPVATTPAPTTTPASSEPVASEEPVATTPVPATDPAATTPVPVTDPVATIPVPPTLAALERLANGLQQYTSLADPVDGLVDKLLQLVGGLLGGGGGEAPSPTDAPFIPAALKSTLTELVHLVDGLKYSPSELTTNLADQVGALVDELLQVVGGL